MALDYVETSKKIIEGVGGAGNIASATHCMTRLRLVLVDEGKADDKKVGKIKGVKSVIRQGGQYQVVIGNEVSNLFKEFKTMGNFGGEGAKPAAKKPTGNPIQRLFGFISGCMTPLLPGMLGTGMIKVLLTIITTINADFANTSTYALLYALGDCFIFFLPIYLAYTAAKKMDGNPILWMTVACAMVHPNALALLAGTGGIELGSFLGMSATSLFGIPVICATYSSSVIPILLMVPVMKFMEDFADRVSPNVLKAFLKPMIFLLVCFPVAMWVLGPLGFVIGNGLSAVINLMYGSVPWLTIAVLSALMPFVVMTGMHYALTPLAMAGLTGVGYDALVIIGMFCSNIAQGGAALGAAVKTKKTELRSEGIACGISATVAGVTEPAMYGINMRYKKPMIGAVIGAGVSGLICGLFHVVAYTLGGSPSFFSIITFIGGDNPMNGVIWGTIAGILSLVISFAISFILFKDEAEEGGEEEAPAPAPAAEAPKSLVEKLIVSSPLTGEVVPLKDVPDEVFSSGTLGEGVAVIPTVGKVIAPCDGEISATMDTKHAVGISAESGLELLIHVGLNTVELGGKHFTCNVSEGDKIKKGDVLLEFDIDAIKAAGYQMHTPVLVTNSDDYVSVLAAASGKVKAGDDLVSVV